MAAIVAATAVFNLVFFCPCAVGAELEGAVHRGNSPLLALATCLVATHGLAVPATAVHQQHHLVESAEGKGILSTFNAPAINWCPSRQKNLFSHIHTSTFM